MESIIFPLTITQVDWSTYIKVCQDILGFSPTRKLDEAHIDLKDPSAFLSSLNMNTNPKDNLRHVDRTFEHISMSFITSGKAKVVTGLMMFLDLKFHTMANIDVIEDSINYLIIMTGTMKQWFDSILTGCSLLAPYDVRIRMNQCYMYFKRSGFKEIWSKAKQENLKDETFILT